MSFVQALSPVPSVAPTASGSPLLLDVLGTLPSPFSGASGRAAAPHATLARVAALADAWRARAEAPDSANDEEEGETQFPDRHFQELRAGGFFTVTLPPEQGGLGIATEEGQTLSQLRLLRHVGRGHLAVGRIYEGHVNALSLVRMFGTPDQFERCAEDVRQDGCLFGVWNAEVPGEGVRLVPAPGRPGRWRLEGSKIFASGAGFIGRPIVNGQLPSGEIQMCVVPMERVRTAVDASWWQPLGMKSTASYRVDFTGVELGPEDLIGGPGDYYREPWFSGGAVRFAAVQLGGAEALYDACRRYLARLGRTGDPFQQARSAEMATLIESGSLWLRGAAEMWQRPPAESATILAYAAMMRGAIEEICTQVRVQVERSVGARGLMRPEPFERMVRDLSMYLRQPAPDAAVARLGRHVLEGHPRVPAHAQWFGGGEGE